MNDVNGQSRTPKNDPPGESPIDSEYWRDRAEALPEIRTEKVEFIRARLKEGNYDQEEQFDEMIRRLSEEMSALNGD